MNPAFKQIGNAVPALFAYAIAMCMRTALGAPTIADMRVSILGLDRQSIDATQGGQ
jgi:DNA (cytosine-5)-methyltransferase 1